MNVPVFTCIVYLLRNEDGTVQGRVANLPDLAYIASNEREAMAKIVKEFKLRIQQSLADGSLIPWIDPPSPNLPEEQVRLIPVHL